MGTYARISDGIVVEIIKPATDASDKEIPVSERFTAAFVDTLVDITSTTPTPDEGWRYDGTTFSAPTSSST